VLRAVRVRGTALRQIGQRLTRTLAVGLGALRRVDAVDAYAVRGLAGIEQRPRVTVGNADDRADPFDRVGGQWKQEKREQQRTAQRQVGAIGHVRPS